MLGSEVCKMIADRLDMKLRDTIDHSNIFSHDSTAAYERPVLMILDRDIDLSVMVAHSWTYQALVHDLLDMKYNRVSVEVTENDKTEMANYDFDESDQFWTENAGKLFPGVAMEITQRVKEYTESVGTDPTIEDDTYDLLQTN